MKKDMRMLAAMLEKKLSKNAGRGTCEVVTYIEPVFGDGDGSIEVSPCGGKQEIYHTAAIMEFVKFFELYSYVTVRVENNMFKLIWRIY